MSHHFPWCDPQDWSDFYFITNLKTITSVKKSKNTPTQTFAKNHKPKVDQRHVMRILLCGAQEMTIPSKPEKLWLVVVLGTPPSSQNEVPTLTTRSAQNFTTDAKMASESNSDPLHGMLRVSARQLLHLCQLLDCSILRLGKQLSGNMKIFGPYTFEEAVHPRTEGNWSTDQPDHF